MDIKTFLWNIYKKEYQPLQDNNLLSYLRLKIIRDFIKTESINNINNFYRLVKFIDFNENLKDKTRHFIINDDELEYYYNFYNIYLDLPNYKIKEYEIDEVMNIIKDSRLKNIKNSIKKINLPKYNKEFELKYCHGIIGIIKVLLKSKINMIKNIEENIKLINIIEHNKNNKIILNKIRQINNNQTIEEIKNQNYINVVSYKELINGCDIMINPYCDILIIIMSNFI